MGDTFIILIKYIGVSSILWSLYWLLFKGKSSFIAQRVYLLSLPIISFLASMLSLRVIEVEQEHTLGRMISLSEALSRSISTNDAFVIINGGAKNSNNNHFAFDIEFSTIILVIVAVISLILLTRFVYGVYKINSIRKLSSHSKLKDISIYRCGLIDTPFSFLRSVYIDRKIDGEKLDIVLTHEMAHINNLHYVDKIISESYIILSWFNPFVWKIRREIALVHEFQADSTVINDNYNIQKYKKYLFDEIIFHSPEMSSGFNNSLIKQRFIQMKNNYQIKNSRLRRALTLPVIAFTVALTSFTYINEEAIASQTDKQFENLNSIISKPNSPLSQTESQHIKEYKSDTVKSEESSKPVKREKDSNKEFAITQVKIDTIKGVITSAKVRNEKRDNVVSTGYFVLSKKDSLEKVRAKYNYYYLEGDQINLTRESLPKVAVYRYDDHTEVDFRVGIPSDWYWLNFSKNTFLIDKRSGDKYKIHSAKDNIPIDRNLVYRDLKYRKAVITLIFPPLKDNVRRVDFVEEYSPTLISPNNRGGLWRMRNLKIEKKRTNNNIITLDKNFKI